MATGAAHGNAQQTADGRRYEQTIDRHLNRTRWQVKLTELGASSVLLLVLVLAYFLVASLIDHWVASLGNIGRGLLLAGLVAGVAYYLWRYLLPLIVRSINPEYAARAIEESAPSLKNSLLNFLLLRRAPTGVKEVVLEALERRAATDIATVPVDAAVDRSKLIKAGYLLVGAMAIVGLYKILSPKDPFQTAARVILPWADIARPSRVQISDIEPGSTEIYLGESATVSAAVAGVREGDPVTVFYSTEDGTVVDQPVAMKAAVGGRFETTLPEGGEAAQISATGGLQKSVIYRIEAGDAVSSEYRLQVIAAPRIVVEKVDYAFPGYTRKQAQSLTSGDIKGIEGTTITISARANQPIESAWIEFDPAPDAGPAETQKLAVSGERATGSFVLQLRPDRRTAWRSTYQVRFINDRKQQSRQPILHGLEVLRDLPPEVEIVSPQAREIEVPVNGSQRIEVRAIDPDFGLSSVKVMGSARNKELVMRSLIDPLEGQPPQLMKRFDFRPAEWNLKVGETLRYWAVAEDNRTSVVPLTSESASSGPQPEPNVAKTDFYTIKIVAPRGDNAGGQKGDEGQQQNNDGAQEDDGQQDSPMNGQNAGANQQNQSGNQGNANQQNQSQSGENSNSSSGSSQQSQDGSQTQSGEQQSGSQSGNSQQNQSQQGGSSSSSDEGGESGSDDSGNTGQGSQGGSGSQSRGGGQQQSGDGQSGEPNSDGSAGQGGTSSKSPSGNRDQGSDGQPGEQTGESGGQSGSQGGQRGGSPPKKPEHDGDVFDRVLEEIEQDQPPNGDSQGGGAGQQTGGGQQNGNQQNAGGSGADQPNSTGQNAEGQSGGNRSQNADSKGGNQRAGERPAGDAASNDQQPGEGNREPGEQGDNRQSPSGAGQQQGGADSTEGNPQPGSKAGSQGSGNAGQNNQPKPDGTSGKAPGSDPMNRGEGDAPNRADNAQGKGPNDQQAPGEGGRPQGAARTDEGDQPRQDASGDRKDPGAGQNGDSGAGQNSKDKTGSGQGQETNRDRQKNMQESNSNAQSGETSAPSGSKRQSDSKGGTSGDRSGGGGKGAGQSGGQEGNDSAGSRSAADEGAGAANEQGMGETGNQGGQGQQKSDGQTGTAGDERGEGSSSRPGQSGDQQGSSQQQQGEPGDQSPMGQPGEEGANREPGEGTNEKPKSNDSQGSSRGGQPGGAGPVVGGGKQGDRQQVDYGPEGEATEADKANLDYAKKATDLVLNKLKEQEHDPDPELLDRLGMSREQMQEFIRRWEGLKAEADRDPKAARELNDALRSLGLRDPKQRTRSGGSVSDDQRNLRDSGTRVAPPSKYRDQFDAFRKGSTRSK